MKISELERKLKAKSDEARNLKVRQASSGREPCILLVWKWYVWHIGIWRFEKSFFNWDDSNFYRKFNYFYNVMILFRICEYVGVKDGIRFVHVYPKHKISSNSCGFCECLRGCSWCFVSGNKELVRLMGLRISKYLQSWEWNSWLNA